MQLIKKVDEADFVVDAHISYCRYKRWLWIYLFITPLPSWEHWWRRGLLIYLRPYLGEYEVKQRIFWIEPIYTLEGRQWHQ